MLERGSPRLVILRDNARFKYISKRKIIGARHAQRRGRGGISGTGNGGKRAGIQGKGREKAIHDVGSSMDKYYIRKGNIFAPHGRVRELGDATAEVLGAHQGIRGGQARGSARREGPNWGTKRKVGECARAETGTPIGRRRGARACRKKCGVAGFGPYDVTRRITGSPLRAFPP